ncbi:alpha/beta-hydrolase [Hypoxylon rubiginosum]|uniref:Alpha/beta-hydrolase n=1 Tax=Hypoxylon rubiginosum TaxID=110542 RepID=A0ACB9YR44_9PEZI|nr:alpha/beta-hydrolase [Hypoxylon rubiginosum]
MANVADPGMEYAYCKANDDCTLAYQTSLPIGAGAATAGAATAAATAATAVPHDATRYQTCVLLLHGFSGSSAYFARNFAALSRRFWVVAPDMRGHGSSGRTRGGFHVARLAADLRTLVAHLRASRPAAAAAIETAVVPVGCSIGAAVLWTYAELFGCGDFAGLAFVDQAPLQDRSPFGGWDASVAHLGCYDEATTLAAQRAWADGGAETHRDLVKACLGYRYKPETEDEASDEERRRRDEEFFTRISAQCDGRWLARLLADHTRYDHREAAELIDVPTLVMAGRRTGCFPLEGMAETATRVNAARPGLAKMSVFDSGHWLFYEEPERFNTEIIDFVDSCGRKSR